jgi:hypothetical protein
MPDKNLAGYSTQKGYKHQNDARLNVEHVRKLIYISSNRLASSARVSAIFFCMVGSKKDAASLSVQLYVPYNKLAPPPRYHV